MADLRPGEVTVSEDLSGGVRLKVGPAVFVLSPQEAIQYATAILNVAGVNVEFSNPGQSVIRKPDRRLMI